MGQNVKQKIGGCCVKTTAVFAQIPPKIFWLTHNSRFAIILHIVKQKELEMSQLTEYTIEVYKADRRIKEGRRLVEKKEIGRAHV